MKKFSEYVNNNEKTTTKNSEKITPSYEPAEA